MKTISFMVAAALMMGGAAQAQKTMHPIELVNDGGRFSQMAWNGLVLMQIDWLTPELCGAALKGSDTQNETKGMSLTCAKSSAATELPFGAIAENDLLGTKSPTHFRSNEFCVAMERAASGESARLKCTGPKN
ncbi:hypothetical protein JNX00_09300 [Hydrogenophaga sp. YM1]|uniref:hypothetical protein n=1 Tax=Hydrogenophaga sp. YM1 TaxID=2806262 RepID=UPI00195C9284|nr:hypothetical protein [Hydrogenophaga sp. YM1]QRR36028.1 hypothetical protein JNX00_09300 [Hydrogenophaga sp. YM1]